LIKEEGNMQPNVWLPLTEYALRSGMSISTLRRKIKSNAVEYKMEEGRYLIRFDEFDEEPPAPPLGFASTDAPRMPPNLPKPEPRVVLKPAVEAPQQNVILDEIRKIREELHLNKDEGSLRWRALEARVAGLAKKLEQFTEQMAELKMLVKIFEEKLDSRA